MPHPTPVHVVQVGWDIDLFRSDAPSDSRKRQDCYAQLLEARRPGSHMTVLVLGAPRGAQRRVFDRVVIEPIAGRWSGVARLPRVLARLHDERPISVLAPQSPLDEGWACLAFARGRIPVVAQVHFDLLSDAALPSGAMLRRALGLARRSISLRLLPSYAAIRTVAPDMAQKLLALGARATKAIPVPILDLDNLLELPVGRLSHRVLFVGRLAPEKNLMLWMNVAGQVAKRNPDAAFDIVGDGALRPALEARAGQLGLDGRIMFHGDKPRADMGQIYRQASVFLLTSHHEGFGRVLVEAIAAGVPVVSTRTAGALDVLGGGEVGVLAETGDAEALAGGVLRLLNDGPERHNFIAAGRRRVAERYRPMTLASQWVDMLIEAVDVHAARSSL